MLRRTGIRRRYGFLVGFLLLALCFPIESRAEDPEFLQPFTDMMSDTDVAGLMAPVTAKAMQNVDAFFGSITALVNGHYEYKFSPGMDYVCPDPIALPLILEKQQEWGFQETYIAFKEFWWFDNAGPGTALNPQSIGDGTKHYIKLASGFPLIFTYCIENMFNPQEGRHKDESLTKACVRGILYIEGIPLNVEECVTLKMGECAMVGLSNVCATPYADQICAIPFTGFVDLSLTDTCQPAGRFEWHGAMCLKALSNFIETEKLDNCVCFPGWIPPSCTDGFRLGLTGGEQLKRLGVIKPNTMLESFVDHGWQITGPIIECVEDTLANLFHGQEKDCTGQPTHEKTLFILFKEKMNKSVTAVLVLAVIFFAMKTILLQYNPGGADFLLVLMKFAIVGWFAIGGGVEYFYHGLLGSARSLVEAVIEASEEGTAKMCNLLGAISDAHLAEGVIDPHLLKLAVWTELDCRALTYIGFGAFTDGSLDFPFMLLLGFAMVILGPIGLLALIVLMVSVSFILLAIVEAVHIFILAAIASSILLFFAPIFVPMVLFNYTKGFFEAWLKELLSHTLFPMIIFLYIGLFMISMNLYMFGDLEAYPETFDALGNMDTDKCDPNAIVCIIHIYKDIMLDQPYTVLSGIFAYTYLTGINLGMDPDLQIRLVVSMFLLALITFLFYSFLDVLMNLAGELTGSASTNIGTSIAVKAVKTGMSAIMKTMKATVQIILDVVMAIPELIIAAAGIIIDLIPGVGEVAMAVETVAETAIEAAIEVTEDVVEETAEAVVETIIDTIVDIVTDMISDMVSNMVEDVLENTLTDMLKDAAGKSLKDVVEGIIEDGVKNIPENVAKEVERIAENFVEDLPNKIIKVAEDAVKNKIEGLRDDIEHLPEIVVNKVKDEIKSKIHKAIHDLGHAPERAINAIVDAVTSPYQDNE